MTALAGAVETVLFLVEGPDDLKQGIRVRANESGEVAKAQGYKAFVRCALKMATGTAKTTVMGMLAAWPILTSIGAHRLRRHVGPLGAETLVFRDHLCADQQHQCRDFQAQQHDDRSRQ